MRSTSQTRFPIEPFGLERSSALKSPLVSFIIPLFNNLPLTRECLASLEGTVSKFAYEVILVDDGSTDGTREYIAGLPNPPYRVIFNSRNQGFAFSNNVGARIAQGEFLCLINSDVRLTPGWLEPMLAAFKYNSRVALVGNVQRSIFSGQIDHLAMRINLKGKPEHIRPPDDQVPRFRRYLRCSCFTGACLLAKRSFFLESGGFDENFINGCEDVDLCFRAGADGKICVTALRSVIWHHVSASRPFTIQNEKNTRYLYHKWWNRIVEDAARQWPSTFFQNLRKNGYNLKFSVFFAAAASRVGLLRRPPKEGIAIAKSSMAIVENHWRAILGRNPYDPDMSKAKFSFLKSFFHPFKYTGFFPSRSGEGTAWIKEVAKITLPSSLRINTVHIHGRVQPDLSNDRTSGGSLGLHVSVNYLQGRIERVLPEGKFHMEVPCVLKRNGKPTTIRIRPIGVALNNVFAYLGRITDGIPLLKWLQPYRVQRKNQRLNIDCIQINGEDLLNFTNPTAPFVYDFITNKIAIGINFIGWFRAELGVGESVRYAVKAADAASVPCALVNCKLNCLAAQGDSTYKERVQEKNPYPVNVFHIDAAQAGDIDHHHGKEFRKNKYNIAYWAWELPEFPDHWARFFQYFEEIWTPSHFVTEAIGRKAPLPVLTMPHAIEFPTPTGDLRVKFGLPKDQFLFLFMYDLNSYQERKNPRAVLEAFRRAFPNGDDHVGVVMKVHGIRGNETDFALLKESIADLRNCHLIPHTLPRDDVYALEAACDCFVSLHRSEGFGLSVAESMYLRKPVISTNWSATAEFVDSENGCPVNASVVTLEQNHGPYLRGQQWADPDIDHAAWFMRRLVEDDSYRKRLATAAGETIRARFSPKTIGKLYHNRLRAIALW